MQAILRNLMGRLPKITGNNLVLSSCARTSNIFPSNNPTLDTSSNRTFSLLSTAGTTTARNICANSNHGLLLKPSTPSINPSCGFKVKGRPKRRCKDCYFVTRQERLYVICPTFPRHKQMAMVEKPKNSWILTHATQGKIRPW